MVKVVVPDGAGPGATVAFQMPSGVTVQITIPENTGPGAILDVHDPGNNQPQQGAPPPQYAPPQYAGAQASLPMATVVGIETMGSPSSINGITVVGPQQVPFGFDIMGDKYGIVSRTLAPQEQIMSEPGAMMFMSDEVKMSAKLGGFGKMFSRVVGGEALAKVSYTNTGGQPGYIGLSSNQPFSMVVPVMTGALPGGILNVKRGAYMAGTTDVTATAKMLPARSCAACCCGGMAPIIQEIRGSQNGVAFLSAAGTIVSKSLQPGEEIIVDSNAVVGFEQNVQYDVRQVGTCATCCLGGEGCYNTVLTGPGHIYLQSITIEKLMEQLVTVQQDSAKGDGGGLSLDLDLGGAAVSA
mmetsp:Transcript_10825/g.37503  ORF Transcript_10825/g.37503 Transcript_10825/m.37503 type:complete len:354 (+) Transcript_10825:80-1141(+)